MIQEEVGMGSFGTVFRASDPKLNRDVAIKIARTDIAHSEELFQRFQNEARTVAALDHQGIVPIYEAGEYQGIPFYVMPFCKGTDLAQWQSHHSSVDPLFAAKLISTVADAVDHGHRNGVVHRDLKPSNIMLTVENGEPLPQVVDFGLADVFQVGLQELSRSSVVGTPLFMSPEQARVVSDAVGPRSDIFSLGAILYQLLVGESPLSTKHYVELIGRLQRCEFPSPRQIRSDIDKSLDVICMKCLRLHPEDRYQTARALADDLNRYLQSEPIEARPSTALERWRWFARRPQRVTEAGIVSLFANGVIACVCVMAILPMPLDIAIELSPSFVITQLLLSFTHFVLAIIAVFIIDGKRWAYLAGFFTSIVNWCCVVGLVTGVLEPLSHYLERQTAMWIMHMILFLMFSTQLAAFCQALPAYRFQKRSNTDTAER
ncbi:MAG: serine/threonine-protein kinase [Planctomycetota bacterium]